MSDVFISYKAEEFDEANWVRTTLETNGISCWMAPMSIPGGSSYAVEIPQAIRNAKIFVLILSKKAQLSKWVPRELDQAINAGKIILPFMLENFPLKDDFNFYLSNVQRYAAYENKSAAIERMIKEIRAHLGERDSMPETKVQPGRTEPAPIGVSPEPTRPASPVAPPASISSGHRKPSTAQPPKNRPAKAKKAQKGSRSKVFAGIVISAVLLVLAAVIGISVFVQKIRTVEIAGEKHKISETSLTLKDKTLTDSDLEQIDRFDQLNSLYFTDCVLPANGLNRLLAKVEYRMELIHCQITDAMLSEADFGGATLTALCLDQNPEISDLRCLAPMSEKLESLSFNGCAVSDLSFLSGFSRLSALQMDDNQASDLTPLASCTKLRRLSAAGNGISSLSPLSSCKELWKVTISRNQLTDLSGLENCLSISTLLADRNRITDIGGLTNATLLSDVDLSDNEIRDVSLLAKSREKLTYLNLSNNELESIDSISACNLITELYIGGNQIQTLDALSGWSKLTLLDASHNEITDLSGIQNCRKLSSLNLSNNRIVSTDSICFDSGAASVTLNLSHNAIETLTLPNVRYRYVAIYANPLSDWSALASTRGSEMVLSYDPEIDFQSFREDGYTDYYVFDCPLDQQIRIGNLLGSYRVHFTTEQEYLQSKNP